MTGDRLFAAISAAIVDVVGKDVAFSNQELTDEQLRAVRERVDTLITLNLQGEKHD